jgi:hypothetical protein
MRRGFPAMVVMSYASVANPQNAERLNARFPMAGIAMCPKSNRNLPSDFIASAN